MTRPRLTVVGLGPAGPQLTPTGAVLALSSAERAFLRTARHPAASPFSGVSTFDHVYEEAATFEEVYVRIVDALVEAASTTTGSVVYAVPGSPLVAERTVELLRADDRVDLEVLVAPSFCDLAWDRLGVDPLAAGVRVVDGTRFASVAAGDPGPLLVGQCWSVSILSEIKLAIDTDGPGPAVTLLHHLGLEDEVVTTLRWADLDRGIAPDHLTSIYIPELTAPVARELMDLVELVATLRERCPWDREQTHASLRRHLLEETYELLDAIDGLDRERDPVEGAPVADAHLEEELGDVLFQVLFHARLAAEEGRFTLADVARGVHDKLVARHPHVFGEVVAETPEAVAANWEVLKRAEKGRTSVTDGVPMSLPALSLAQKLQSRASGVVADAPHDVSRTLDELQRLGRPDEPAADELVGQLLFDLAGLARQHGVDAELALRAAAQRFADDVRTQERAPGG